MKTIKQLFRSNTQLSLTMILHFQILLIFLIVFQLQAISQETENKKAIGNWSGNLDVSSAKIELIFKVMLTEGDLLAAKMDVPQQGATDIPVTEVSTNGDSLILVIRPINGNFKGFFKDKESIEGTWSQNGMSLSLTLTKTDKVIEFKRPQTPVKPYPYLEEEVIYQNKNDGITLAGTLTIPNSEGKFPAVVLITGSGAQDRDETIFGHKPFLVLADYLTRNGFAVLRTDDRGVGGSEGDIRKVTSEELAGDALAGVNYLKNHPKIDNSRIGLIGHSEGGIIAPIAANNLKDISFMGRTRYKWRADIV
ncbi:MAG: alpha/beta hydrolase [Mariniphaga sp.]|nr:alpha/beta hydrolase [Mariniphaga sp.]